MSLTLTLTVKMFARMLRCSFTDKRCILCEEQAGCPFVQWHEELNKNKEVKLFP
jgi:hypothetical protein